MLEFLLASAGLVILGMGAVAVACLVWIMACLAIMGPDNG